MHETGFKTALTRVLNDYARKYELLKGRRRESPARTCREGLTAVISVKLTDAQFEGQTKAKLGNTDIAHAGRQHGQRTSWRTFLEENPAVGQDDSGQGHDGQPGPGGGAQGAGDRSGARRRWRAQPLPGKLARLQRARPER